MKIESAYKFINNYITSDRYKKMAKHYLEILKEDNPRKIRLKLSEIRRLKRILKNKKV